MESFYGGRQGNPFIIVKRFDGIDIPQPNSQGHYTYRAMYCAIDLAAPGKYLFEQITLENGGVTFVPITKTAENQYNYTWAIIEKDGRTISSNGDLHSYTTSIEYAEGMLQCFKQGGSTASEVNYGEYVLIDTHSEMLDPNNTDNGKVFRRGMDYNNSLGGAEFIGNIIGPQGLTPRVDMDSYNNIQNIPTADIDNYTVENNDIVPGFDGVNFNDNIQYAWVNLRDERNNISTCLIGFKFPYLVLEMIATPESPYVLDTENLIDRIDNEKHPYYEKWKIRVPKGKHGTDATNIEIYGTKSLPNVKYYSSNNFTNELGFLPNQSYELVEYVKDQYASLYYNGNLVYIKPKDTWGTKLRYTETSYELNEEGSKKLIDIGPYNTIKKITTDENGVVSVIYSYDEPDMNIGQLTYLLEAIITKANSGYNIDANHLLVLFSNYNGSITYFSEKFQKEIDGYIDLGYVKGDPGPGLSVIASYNSVDDLPSDPNTIPGYQPGCGVSVGTSFYIYDANSNQWVYIGDINDINPENVIRLTTENTSEEDTLQEYGVWLVTDTIKFAE